ncbi:MAG: hypothetical protein HZB26_05060 [Candidatus Hydrogenedentes bacterium]|nr:hypothetical protein [Candidatus Hydrogenedentota bacterium]
MRYWCSFLVVSLYSMSASAAVWIAVRHVDIDSPAPAALQDGSTWATAFDTIQEGVDAASNAGGGEVWVAEGTYTSSGAFVVEMRENVHLYGGFVGNGTGGGETMRGQRDWTVHATALDGQGARSCVLGASNATLDGFTLKNGQGVAVPMTPFSRGGAVLSVGVSPTIANCLVVSNTAKSGGAVYCEDASGVITNCVFLANSVMYNGAALSIGGAASPAVSHCIFTRNSSDFQGNAVSLASPAPTALTNCVFVGNTGTGSHGGGALIIEYGSPVVANCLFAGNRAGAITSSDASPVIVNSTFDRNVSDAGAGAIINSHLATPTVTNCILWGSTPAEIYNGADSSTTVTYSDIEGGHAGEGNVTPFREPRFMFGPSGKSTGLVYETGKFKSTLSVAGSGFAPDALVGSILWVAGATGDTAHVVCGNAAESIAVWGDVTEGGSVVSPVDFAVIDYRLAPDSPCLDTGRDTSATEFGSVTADILGAPRGSDGAGDGPTGPPAPGDGSDYDMGAYEMPQAFAPADVDHSGDVDAVDIQLVINQALDIATGYDCDIDNSGAVDAVDVQLVINGALHIA